MELVGPVMMKNVQHYSDGSSIGEVDPHDEETRNELVSFLFDAEASDPSGLAARFEHDFAPDDFVPSLYGGLVVAVKDDLIAGFMDYSKTELHDPVRVAQVNIIVAQEHHGMGLARSLASQTDAVLVAQGCQYKFSRVWESNVPQLERMDTRGWRADPTLSAQGATRAFWIALDETLKDVPPPRLRASGA